MTDRFDNNVPNVKSSPRKCSVCPRTGTGQVRRATGPWRLARVGNRILCSECWDKRYIINPFNEENILLRKNCVEAVHADGEKIIVSKIFAKKSRCPITGADITSTITSTGEIYSTFLLVPKMVDGVQYDDGWSNSFDQCEPVWPIVAGLRYEDSRQLVMANRINGAVVVAPDGRRFVLSARNPKRILFIDDCVEMECKLYAHKTELYHYARKCPVTRKLFYSSKERYSIEGREILKKNGGVICANCGEMTVKEGAMVCAGKVYCQSCVEGNGAIYYEGVEYTRGTGRSIGIELELEVSPAGQAAVQRIPGDDVMAIDGAGMKVRMNIPPVSATEDGSLRGKHPVEYVSPILYESNYKKWTKDLCDAMSGNTRVYSRAGFHIHLGSKDLSWFDILRLGCHCQLHEKLYRSMVAPTRWFNQFVSTLPDFLFAKDYIRSREDFFLWYYGRKELGLQGKRSRRANEMNNHMFPSGVVHRYHWLNLHSHVYRRTVEVRLHHATANADKINNWVSLWLDVLGHIQSGRDWKASPLDITSSRIRSFYEGRIGTFSGMRNPEGYTLGGIYANIGVRKRGLLTNIETWKRAQHGESGDVETFDRSATNQEDILREMERHRRNGADISLRLIISRDAYDYILRNTEGWGNTHMIFRERPNDRFLEVSLSQMVPPTTRQRADYIYADGRPVSVRHPGDVVRRRTIAERLADIQPIIPALPDNGPEPVTQPVVGIRTGDIAGQVHAPVITDRAAIWWDYPDEDEARARQQ